MPNSLMIIPKVSNKVLTEAEIHLMFAAVEGDLRLEVMLKIMWQTAVRNSELRLLKTVDVDTKNHVITFLSCKKRDENIVKPRKTIPINNELNVLLKQYNQQYLPEKYFFFPLFTKSFEKGAVGNKEKPISKAGIEYIIETVAEKAGVQKTHIIKKRTHDKKGKPIEIKRGPTLTMKKVTPHTFRHSSATYIMRTTKDIELVKIMLDHESIMSSQKYIHYNLEDKIEKMKGVFEYKREIVDGAFG